MSLVAAELAERVIARALDRGGDRGELYVEDRHGFSLSLDDRRVERPQSGREVGASVRVVVGEQSLFGHVDGLAEVDLLRLAESVAQAVGGVLLHEAVGHGLEADAVQKRASVYAGRLGERLAEPFVTAYDDGRRPNEWGSDGIDDEGTPTQRTTVIAGGELSSYLYDRLRARRDGVASTGNGRRESFRHLPVPRMTNTYFAPGEASPEELIGGVERGLYAVSFGGGQVEPPTAPGGPGGGGGRRPDEFAGLPERCGAAAAIDGLRSPALAGWTTEGKVELAVEIERAARAHRGVTQVEDTVYADGDGRVAIANSRGFSPRMSRARPGPTPPRSPARAPTS